MVEQGRKRGSMKIVIDISEKRYKDIQRIAWMQIEYHHFKTAEQIITNGTPLPKGHGRLIDADVLKTAFPCGESVRTECVRATIDYAPTIIEADKAESEDKLDGNPVDIDKAVEHYEGTLEVLKGIDLEVDG